MIIMLVKVQYFVKEREDTVPDFEIYKGCLHPNNPKPTWPKI